MGTKKTTAKAEPAKGKVKVDKTAMLKPGDIWTHPDSGKKYVAEVGECDETCAFGSKASNHCNGCPITRADDNKRPICTENGVHLVDVASAKPPRAKKPIEDKPADAGRRYVLISVDNIEPSPYQTRKDGDVSGLVDSIRTYGVLNPVTVRENPEAGYELIAGHRRWMAAQQAGLTLIPAIVIECDDQTAAEMCVTENMQRCNLSPIEEAEGVKALIGTGHTLDDIANRLGRTRQWVARRASLVHLTPAIKARLEKPDDILSQAPIEILEIMSRMPYDAQERLLFMFNNGSVPSVGAMRARAETLMCSLKKPAFSVKQCLSCTKRTGASPDLFDEIDGKLGNCLDADCYAEKTLKAKQLLVEDLRRDNADIVIVSKDWMLVNKIPGLQGVYSHTECPKEAPDAIQAVEIKEDGNVRNFFVHKPATREEPETEEQPEEVPYEDRVRERMVSLVVDWFADWGKELGDACAEKTKRQKTPFCDLVEDGNERVILRLIGCFGTFNRNDEESLSGAEAYESAALGDMTRKLWCEFADNLSDSLEYSDDYATAGLVARECGFATEKQLRELAKAQLKTEGVADPDEAEEPKTGKAKEGKK